METVVIVEACRTAVGNMGGALKPLSAENMATAVIKDLVTRSGISPEKSSPLGHMIFCLCVSPFFNHANDNAQSSISKKKKEREEKENQRARPGHRQRRKKGAR